MSISHRTIHHLIIFFCLSVFAIGGVAQAADKTEPAPDFTLKSRDGKNIRLAEQRGQVIMINFWASWCGPCREEMPLLEDLYQRYQAMGFTILGVNVDEDSSEADKLLEEIQVSFPVLYDPDNRVADRYQVEAMPSTVMVDRDGKMRFSHLGYLPGYEKRYEAEIRALIKE